METNASNEIVTEKRKKRILTSLEYSSICNFIQHYHGLAIDCEMEMVDRVFNGIDRLTLKSILQTELSTRLRAQHWQNEAKAIKYLKA